VRLAELQGDVVILACAISAGVHAALIEDHFHEGIGPGSGFVAATALSAAAAVALTRRQSPLLLTGTAALFVGLLVSYALAITTGVPVLHPEVETVDGLALFTKAVEGVGLLAATSLLRPDFPPAAAPEPKGTTT
jgi:CHASE2 domain-containing sensor protein